MLHMDHFSQLSAFNPFANGNGKLDHSGITSTFNAPLKTPIQSTNNSKRVYYCQRCLNHGRLAPRKNHKSECVYSQCNCEKCILVERRRVLNTQLHELEELDGQLPKEEGGQQPTSPFNQKSSNMAEPKTSSPTCTTLSSMVSSAAQSPLSTSSVLLATADSTINDFFLNQQQSMFFPSSASSPASTTVIGPGGYRLKGERVPNCQKCAQHGRKARLKGHKRYCAFKDCTCAKCQVISERQKLMADQIKIRRRQSKDTWMKMRRERLNADAALNASKMGNSNQHQMGLTGAGADSNGGSLTTAYFNHFSQLYKQLAGRNIAPLPTHSPANPLCEPFKPSIQPMLDSTEPINNSSLLQTSSSSSSPSSFQLATDLFSAQKPTLTLPTITAQHPNSFGFESTGSSQSLLNSLFQNGSVNAAENLQPTSGSSHNMIDSVLAQILQQQHRESSSSITTPFAFIPSRSPVTLANSILPNTPHMFNGMPMELGVSYLDANQFNFSSHQLEQDQNRALNQMLFLQLLASQQADAQRQVDEQFGQIESCSPINKTF